MLFILQKYFFYIQPGPSLEGGRWCRAPPDGWRAPPKRIRCHTIAQTLDKSGDAIARLIYFKKGVEVFSRELAVATDSTLEHMSPIRVLPTARQ